MNSHKQVVKQRKVEKKKKQEELNKIRKIVQEANDISDPLKPFNCFQKYTANDLNLSISFSRVTNLDENAMNSVFILLKENMQTFYESCDWGWNDFKKYDEMTENAAKYLLVKDEGNKIVAFSHFRFDIDFGVEVLYVYELQISADIRRHGLGKFLLQTLELIAFSNNMKKVVLTVLKHNHGALHFFKSMNYTMDDTCPEDSLFESYSYVILSKLNKRLFK